MSVRVFVTGDNGDVQPVACGQTRFLYTRTTRKNTTHDPAALKAKMKIKSSGFEPESAQNTRCPQENDSPEPPPDPPGGGETRTK